MADDARAASLVDPQLSPLADRRGPGFVVSESTRRVVMLDRSRRRLLAETAAAGDRCILLTGERTAVTPAYAALSAMTGGCWVVRSRHGLRDALSGRRLTRVEEVLEAPNPLVLAPEHVRDDGEAAVRVDIACSIRHRNPERAEFGASLEALLDELLDETALSWGSAEPALVPWDGAEVAAWIRERLERTPLLIAAGEDAQGRRAAATIRVRPTTQGSEEVVALSVELGPPESEDAAERLERLGDALAALAEEGVPLVATAHARYARPGLLQGSTLEMPPVPMALLLGAPAVARFELDIAELEARHDCFPIGEPRAPGLVATFGAEIRPTNFVDLRELILELDRDALVEQLGEEFLAGLLGAGWREAAERAELERAAEAGAAPETAPAPDAIDDRTLPPPEDGWHAEPSEPGDSAGDSAGDPARDPAHDPESEPAHAS